MVPDEQEPARTVVRVVVFRDCGRILPARDQSLDAGREGRAHRAAPGDRGRFCGPGYAYVAIENLALKKLAS